MNRRGGVELTTKALIAIIIVVLFIIAVIPFFKTLIGALFPKQGYCSSENEALGKMSDQVRDIIESKGAKQEVIAIEKKDCVIIGISQDRNDAFFDKPEECTYASCLVLCRRSSLGECFKSPYVQSFPELKGFRGDVKKGLYDDIVFIEGGKIYNLKFNYTEGDIIILR